jgi:hypothetical protein
MTEDNAPRDAGRDVLALGKSHESKAYQGRRGDNGIQSLALRTNPKHFIVTIPEVPGFAGQGPQQGSHLHQAFYRIDLIVQVRRREDDQG